MIFGIKKKWLIVIGVMLLFVVTNPGPAAFKSYQGLDERQNYSDVKRKLNLFVCSLYEDSRASYSDVYLGILGNIFHVSSPGRRDYVARVEQIERQERKKDSLAIADKEEEQKYYDSVYSKGYVENNDSSVSALVKEFGLKKIKLSYNEKHIR